MQVQMQLLHVIKLLLNCRSITYVTPVNQPKVAGNKVFQIINRKPIISFEIRGKILDRVDRNIDIHDVYFAYPSRRKKWILQGFSLSILAGKTMALVGSSGCGKSTVISLVARFYDPSKGLQLLRYSLSSIVYNIFFLFSLLLGS